MSERRYSKSELEALLRIASEMQNGTSSSGNAAGGYSFDDIAHLAGEVGIEPRYIEMATQNFSTEIPKKRKFLLWGAPLQVAFERYSDRVLSEADWLEIVSELELSFKTQGTTRKIGSINAWQSTTRQSLQIECSASPKQSRTRLRIEINQGLFLLKGWGTGIVCSFFSAVGVGNLMESHEMAARSGFIATCIIWFISTNWFLGWWSEEQSKIAVKIFDASTELQQRISDSYSDYRSVPKGELASVPITGSLLG